MAGVPYKKKWGETITVFVAICFRSVKYYCSAYFLQMFHFTIEELYTRPEEAAITDFHVECLR